MSLESQLIKGAFKATATDPDDIVGEARRGLSKTLQGGLDKLVKQKQLKKKEEEIEADLVKKEEEAQAKGYDAAWGKIRGEMDKNLGSLDMGYWQKANASVQELKAVHDLCTPGKEGDSCRQEQKMRLGQFVAETKDSKTAITDLMDTQGKFDDGTLELSKTQTLEQKAILAQIDGAHASFGGSNDTKIAELTEQMESVSGEEKIALQEQIEQLEYSNKPEYGWDVTYTDNGEEISRRVTKDEFGSLLPHVAKDVTVGYKTALDSNVEKAQLLKQGESGGEVFNKDRAASVHEKSINESNIASIYADNVLNTDQPLKEHLKTHPVLTGMKYSNLGIDPATMLAIEGEEGDGVLDQEEWDSLSDEHIDLITTSLSDPNSPDYNFEASKKVAAGWMADNEEMEINKELYGPEYYPPGDPPYTIPNYLGEGDMTFNTPQEYQQALKTDRTTLRNGGRENEEDFLRRGGIKGMMQSGTVLVQREEGMVAESVKTTGELN